MKRFFMVTVAAIAAIAAFAVPAHAGGNSTLPPETQALTMMAGPCGSSYSHIGHYAIKNNSGTTLAYLDVYWSWSTDRNCLVVNHSGPTYGERAYTEAKIRPSGRSWPSCPSSTGCDGGMYSYYAGPVYTPAGLDMTNRCVDISGTIGWFDRTLYRRHCG